MEHLTKLSLRYLKQNTKKVLVIVLSIILSTMLLTSVSLAASTIRGHNINDAKNRRGSHHVTFINQDNRIYENLSNDPNVKEIITLQYLKTLSSSQIVNYQDELNFNITVKSFDKAMNKYITLVSGRYPKNNKEIIIPLGLTYLIDKTSNQIDDYIIVGIYDDNTLGINDRSVVITKENINTNLKADYLVTLKNSLNTYNLIYKKADKLGFSYTLDKFGNRVYSDINTNDILLQALGHYPDLKTQISIYSWFIIILLVISMFSIMNIKNSFAISSTERKKYFATLRSIGASKKQIFKMTLFETLILSIVAIPLGLILGYLFTGIVTMIVNNILSEIIINNYGLIFDPIYLIISFIFIVGTIIISAFESSKKSSEVAPIELIRGNKNYSVLKSKENYPFIKKIFGIEGEIAYKTIKRNNSKFSVTVNSLIISVILFLTLSTFSDFILVNNEYEINDNYDITLSIHDLKGNDEILTKIKNIESIEAINIDMPDNYRDFVWIEIKAKDYIQVDRQLNKIFDDYKDVDLENNYNNYPLKNYEVNVSVTSIRFIICAVLIFIIIIALMNIFNTMNTNLALRETEFSVLRSIGLSKKSLNKILLFESLFLGIKTLIYGLPSATLFVLGEMFLAKASAGDFLPFPTKYYIITIIAVFIITFIMTLYSTTKIKNKNIIDSIRKQSI